MKKIKSIIILLISLLLSSCNVNSNKSEEIYHLDGLASNLFVYDVMEEYMEFTYIEETDSYDLYVGIKDKFAEGYPCDYRGERFLGLELKGKDIVIPNVYDDGIHGLKRVKSFEIEPSRVGYLNSLIVSEGLERIKGTIINQYFKSVYLPSTINEMDKFYSKYPYFVICQYYLFDLEIYYAGSLEQFKDIDFLRVSWLENYLHYEHEHKVKIHCNNGNIECDFVWYWFYKFWIDE